MIGKPFRKRQRGQGLVEYAIILALVALVSIVILGVLGLAISRGYGVLCGALGCKNEVKSGETLLYFDSNQLPRCGYYGPGGTGINEMDQGGSTGLYVQFYSKAPLSALSVSTEKGFIVTVSEKNVNGEVVYAVAQPQLAQGRHDEVCPHTIVIQASKEYGGTTAIYPVDIKDWTP